MYFKSLIFLIVLFSGCASEHNQIQLNPTKQVKSLIDNSVSYSEFDYLVKELKYDCDLDGYIDVYKADKYIRLDFSSKLNFKTNSYELSDKSKKSLKCIADTILNYNDLTFQLIGHSNDSISIAHNRYLAKNRAIAAASILYAEGVYDLYAKGCPVQKELYDSDLFLDSGLEVYVYHNNFDLKNPCPNN